MVKMRFKPSFRILEINKIVFLFLVNRFDYVTYFKNPFIGFTHKNEIFQFWIRLVKSDGFESYFKRRHSKLFHQKRANLPKRVLTKWTKKKKFELHFTYGVKRNCMYVQYIVQLHTHICTQFICMYTFRIMPYKSGMLITYYIFKAMKKVLHMNIKDMNSFLRNQKSFLFNSNSRYRFCIQLFKGYIL